MFMKLNLIGKIFGSYKVEKKNTSLKPIEPILKVEKIKKVNRDTVTFSSEGMLMSNKQIFKQRIKVAMNLCASLIDRYDNFGEYEKHEHIGSICIVKEFNARLETFLNLLEKRTSKEGLEDLFEKIEVYFYRIDMTLPDIAQEINGVELENKKGLK